MRRALGSTLLGAAIGLVAGLGVGGLTMLVSTVSGWPGADSGPRERARHLAEGISQGMFVASIAVLVLVPVCAAVFALRNARNNRSAP